MRTQLTAEAYARFYEKLTPDTPRAQYAIFFDTNSEFSDPFQSVKGIEAIENVFTNMYAKLYNPRFIIDEVLSNEDVAYIRWHFHYALTKGSKEESFTGISRVTFTASAKVSSHIDYWDAATHVYEKIPLLGTLLRFIKRKIES
ncbi:MAG: nuclear transport factor 2 family protein [Campylobacterales bacterium]|nr:nuclear transport factor 2 family protein [Campylobacterales bacterium]